MVVEKKLKVKNARGLHLKAASQIAKTALRYACDTKLLKDSAVANAKSVLNITALMVPQGETVTLVADGEDAEEAVTAISLLFDELFGERA